MRPKLKKRLESGLKETDKLSAIILQNQIELFSKLRFSQSISQFCMKTVIIDTYKVTSKKKLISLENWKRLILKNKRQKPKKKLKFKRNKIKKIEKNWKIKRMLMDNFTQRPTADNTIVVTSLEFLNNKKRFVHFIPEIYGPSFYTWY